MSLRFILNRNISEPYSQAHMTSIETILLDVPELERLLRRGGYGAGHDITSLLGVEVVEEPKP
jgi:hypothetical protein